MKYLEGTEHDIDVVLFNRKLVAAFVSDNAPTKKGFFTETAACMPSCLPNNKIEQLITAAYQCCTEIGLVSGVFNVEMKMTPTGPKLIEINARMGGYYLRDWIKEIYGVDLIRCVFMIACGIKPLIHNPTPRFQMMGVICVPSVHAPIFKDTQIYDLIKTYTPWATSSTRPSGRISKMWTSILKYRYVTSLLGLETSHRSNTNSSTSAQRSILARKNMTLNSF